MLGFIVKLALAIAVAVVVVFGGTNAWVIFSTKGSIASSAENAAALLQDPPADAIVVLGASVKSDGTPSDILQARLDDAVHLYELGVADTIIMSGDNSGEHYRESEAMRDYAVSRGVPANAIICDNYGVSTYDSMYRIRNVFNCESIVVVTQEYHLYRALYAAQGLGMQAVGVSDDTHSYQNQQWFDLREIPARTKDFFQVLLKMPAGVAETLQDAAVKTLEQAAQG